MIEAVRRLREFYGLLPPPPADVFQFFLWEILSRDAIPARRDLAWLAFRRIPALTPDAVFRAPAKELLDAVGLTGPYREDKVDLIRAVVGEFKRHRARLETTALSRAGLPAAVRALKRLSQIDVSVRRRALLFAGGFLLLPVDAEIARVVGRLSGADPILLPYRQRPVDLRRSQRAARRWLVERLPRDLDVYRDATLYLRHHGMNTCILIGPHCTVCPLRENCVAGSSSAMPPEKG